MSARKQSSDKKAGNSKSTTPLTFVSSVFIIFIVGSLLLVGQLTRAIQSDVAWVEPAVEADAVGAPQPQYHRARLANIPEDLTNEDEVEQEKLRSGELGRDDLRGDIVSELLDSDEDPEEESK